MLIHATLAMALLMNVSAPANAPFPITSKEKAAAVAPVINQARKCIAQTVASAGDTEELTSAIVKATPNCLGELRSMINTIDDIYGKGNGDAYFEHFLDTLPTVVKSYLEQLKTH